MPNHAFLGERYPSRVAAAFADPCTAQQAANELRQETGLSQEQIHVVDPYDPSVASKTEPVKQGIARTVVRTHLLYGGLGLFAGTGIAATMLGTGLIFASSQPVKMIVTLAVFGAVTGLLIG